MDVGGGGGIDRGNTPQVGLLWTGHGASRRESACPGWLVGRSPAAQRRPWYGHRHTHTSAVDETLHKVCTNIKRALNLTNRASQWNDS